MWENEMIRYADIQDFSVLKEHDRHISEAELKNSIAAKRIIIMHQGDAFMGWLRFGLFWDNIPFMNMLYILEEHRGQGRGTELAAFWEAEMSRAGYGWVMTSTQSDERAQFFYRKLGYCECGALLLPKEPLEMLFIKELR